MKKWELIRAHKTDPGRSNNADFLSLAARVNLTWLAEKAISVSGWISGMIVSQLNIPDFSGWLPIHMATHSEAVEMLEWLLANGSAVNVPVVGLPTPGLTPLHIAATKKNNGPKMVEMLLDKQANPNATTKFGKNTPLHSAVKGGLVATVKLLLEAKTPPDPVNRINWTPLQKRVPCQASMK